MSDLSNLSDDELMRLYSGASEPAAAPAGVGQMSDAELLRLYQGPVAQQAASTAGPQSATDMVFGGEDPAPQVAATDMPAARLNALGRGLANGATFGFADKIAAGMGSLTGIGGRPDDYEGNLKAQRAQSEADKVQNPAIAYPAQIAGGAGVMGSLVKAGVTAVPLATKALPNIFGRIAGFGADGAIAGALGGVGHSDTASELLSKVGVGAATGLAFGAGMPIAGRIASSTYKAAAPLFGKPIEGVSSSTSKMLSAAAREDLPEELSRMGPSAMLVDAGPLYKGLGEGVANKIGSGQTRLVNALERRNETRNDRLAEAATENFGPAESPVALTAQILGRRKTETGPLFQKAFDEAPPVDATNVIATIGQRLNKAEGHEKDALTKALDMLRQRDPETGAMVLKTDAQRLHNIKGELDNLIKYGDPKLGIPAGALSREQGALKTVRSDINTTLREQVPGYGAANDASASYAKAAEAIEAGQSVLDGGKAALWPADLASKMSTMAAAEQGALKAGVRGNIENRVGTMSNDLAALKKALGGERDWNRDKMGMLFGEKPTAAMANTVDSEGRFAATYADIARGSRTAPKTSSSEIIDRAGLPDIPASTTLTGGSLRLLQEILRGGARAVVGARSDAIRTELGDILSRQGADRDKVVEAIIAAARARGQRAQTIEQVVSKPSTLIGLLTAGQERQRGVGFK